MGDQDKPDGELDWALEKAATLGSMAATLVKVGLATATSPAGVATLSFGMVVGLAEFIGKVISFLSTDQRQLDALAEITERVERIEKQLERLTEAFDTLAFSLARESNRATLRELRRLKSEIAGHTHDVQRLLANRANASAWGQLTDDAGRTVDAFLEQNLDVWRWVDIEVDTEGADRVLHDQFKNVPTLPLYVAAVAIWLTARERTITLDSTALTTDGDRLARHYHAVNAGRSYNRLAPQPSTIADHISQGVVGHITVVTPRPRQGLCDYDVTVFDAMTRTRLPGHTRVRRPAEPGTQYCSMDSWNLARTQPELDAEQDAGLAALNRISAALDTILRTGRLSPLTLDTSQRPTVDPIIWALTPTGTLTRRRHQGGGANAEGTWDPPEQLAQSWDHYLALASAGGPSVYVITEERQVLYRRLTGNTWSAVPLDVDQPAIVGGGGGVLYTLGNDHLLRWWQHNSQEPITLSGPVVLGPWDYHRTIGAGNGYLYGIRTDGTLVQHIHTSWRQGTPDLSPGLEIGTGWADFDYVVALRHINATVFYALTRSGELLWYRHGTRPRQPRTRLEPHLASKVPHWQGPITTPQRFAPGTRLALQHFDNDRLIIR